jgi:hypothetical protein
MLKHDRFKYAALGSVIGIATSLIFFVWSVPEFRDPYAKIRYAGLHEVKKPQEEDISRLTDDIREFNPWEDTYAQWVMAIISALASGFSIYAVFLVKDTLKATLRAASEAERSANAAFSAVRISEETAERQLRAYMMFQCIVFHEYFEDNNKIRGIEFRSEWRNNGQTPAWNCIVLFEIKVINISDHIDINFIRNAGWNDKLNAGVVGPGVKVISIAQRITINSLKSIVDRRVEIYLIGRVEYVDTFNVKRWTECCMTIEVVKPVEAIANGDTDGCVVFRVVGDHNNAT